MQNMLLSFWTWLGSLPTWAIVLIVVVAIVVIFFVIVFFASLKDMITMKVNPDELGKDDPDADAKDPGIGYYRYQPDRQPVVKRTEQQQRIFSEYFVIKNSITMHPVFCILAIVFILAGACMAGFTLKTIGVVFWVGLGLIALGVVAFVIFDKTKKCKPEKLMSSKEYEELVSKKIAALNVPDLGMKRLGLDPDEVREIAPVMLRDKSFTKTSFKVYDPSDGTLHSSTQWVAMLYFTDEQLLLYKIEFDMCCNVQTEWTSVFYYKDICDVSTHFSENVIALGKEKFAYRTMDFVFITTNSKMGFSMSGKNHGAASIASMRQKIRERKRPRRRY